MAKNLAEQCSGVLWKVELESDTTAYLPEDIVKQNIEGVAWFFLTVYSKM